MKIVWKRNDTGGANGYVGKIRIGQYWYNGVDSKNGKYKVTCLLPQSSIIGAYADSDGDARNLIEFGYNDFMKKLNDNN